MNLAQTIDQETGRPRESGIRGAFKAAVRETLGRISEGLGPWWMRPQAPKAETLGFAKGTARAQIVEALEAAGRALRIPELRAAVPGVRASTLKQTVVEMVAMGQLVKHGECKSYRYGLPR